MPRSLKECVVVDRLIASSNLRMPALWLFSARMLYPISFNRLIIDEVSFSSFANFRDNSNLCVELSVSEASCNILPQV